MDTFDELCIKKLARTNDPQTSKDAAKRMEYPKLIPLTQGKFAIVDAEDYEKLSKYNWFTQKDKYTFYAVRSVGTKPHQKRIFMHREILDTPFGMEVDHHNHNGLDNRRGNIRNCTKNENQHNQKPRKGLSSKYKGVHWHKRDRIWEAGLRYNGKDIHLGRFDSEIEAAKIYDKKANELYGEFARTNF